jgi:hypothetical protein
MDLARIAAAANKLYLPPPLVKTLLPTSQSHPQTWKYTFKQPEDAWYHTNYEDSDWQSGPGGFGTDGTPGTSVRTVWNTSDIWVRRSFDLDEIPSQGDISLTLHHDEDAEVYINGRLVQKVANYTTSYNLFPLAPKAVEVLKAGRNLIAIHCHQTRGGQYIDAGLSLLIENVRSTDR